MNFLSAGTDWVGRKIVIGAKMHYLAVSIETAN